MPIYEYVCQQCGHALDALQKINDEPLLDCPECHAASLKRKISAPSFRLKGQGWYETDFKSDKDRRRNLADGGDGKADGKADSGGDKADKADKADSTRADATPKAEPAKAAASSKSGGEAA